MDFALSEEQQAIFDMAHAFGQEHIAPHARELGGCGHHPARRCGRRWPNWASAASTSPRITAGRG